MTRARIASREGEGVPLRILIPPPRHAWGGWPSRSDGRVGAVSNVENIFAGDFFKTPPRLAIARRPSPQGEGKEKRRRS